MNTEILDLDKIIEYLKDTTEDSWCMDVCRKDNKNCLLGHIFEYGGGDNGGSEVLDWFEDAIATTYMFFPVNDGEHPDYTQETPKQRCIAYLENIRDGKEMTTHQIMDFEMNRMIDNGWKPQI